MVKADTMPVETRDSMLQAFGSFKQRFLWKWENDTLPNKPDNVYIQKWLQQREILCKCIKYYFPCFSPFPPYVERNIVTAICDLCDYLNQYYSHIK